MRIDAVRLAARLGLPHAPTPEQVQVIEAPLDPLLVVAGAGSGKTETMAARVVWLVENGLVRADEVLGLTFTRKAAAELSERIDRRLRRLRASRGTDRAPVGEERPTISTYNAYAAGLVRDHALRVGVDPGARLFTEAGRWQLAQRVVESWNGELPLEPAPSTVVGAVVDLAGAVAEHLLTPADAAGELLLLAQALAEKAPSASGRRLDAPRPDVRRAVASLRDRAALMSVVAAFQARKEALGVVDFADQVALACRVARELPEVRAGERERYKVVLLDEYQDTSVAQVALLAALFDGGHAVTAVGDPHQAIYGWRGASAGAVDRFPATFRRADGARGRVSTLATSWRNDTAVLAAANVLAGPLRTRTVAGRARRADVSLPVLAARPGAAAGRVRALYSDTAEDEAERVAEVLDEIRREHAEGGRPPTTAVLCRARSHMPGIVDALRRHGLPVEVVGLGGLLATPEVADLHAALLVAHDPLRADAAMRLLNRLNLGIADLAALNERARELSGRVPGATPTRESETATIVEAIEHPPGPAWRSRSGRALSASGGARVRQLGDVLRTIRAQAHVPLPDLVTAVERLMSLDIEALARPGSDPRAARRHLDQFAETAAGFGDGSAEPSLGAFLAWLDAAAEHERGLDTVEVTADASAVQVLTVHAAKGLEWDVVAVVGMGEGTFPSYDGRPCDAPSAGAWLTALDTLPYPVRQDADDLPWLDVEGPGDHGEMAAECAEFRSRAGAHCVDEERRLAYVALTRARHELVLSGSWWKDQARQPRPPSRFLGELRRAGAALDLCEDSSWTTPAEGENPLSAAPRSVDWPASPPPRHAAALRRAVTLVHDARQGLSSSEFAGGRTASFAEPLVVGATEALSERARTWLHDAELLVAEQRRAIAPDLDVALPAHLSASSVVRLVADPAGFALERRRPVPVEPSPVARRGTRFHEWVERHFGAAALLDVHDLSGADDAFGVDPELAALQESFLASSFASRTPLAVEVALETPVAGAMIRCRVDAVFADEHGVQIVDWKTGRPPKSGGDARARQVQLALYRLAWSRLHGLPLDSVRAAFYHVAQDVVVPAEPMTEDEILEVVSARIAAGRPTPGLMSAPPERSAPAAGSPDRR